MLRQGLPAGNATIADSKVIFETAKGHGFPPDLQTMLAKNGLDSPPHIWETSAPKNLSHRDEVTWIDLRSMTTLSRQSRIRAIPETNQSGQIENRRFPS